MSDKHISRLDYEGRLADVFNLVCTDFGLPSYKSHSLIPVGYEDVNFKLETNNGSYFVKIFSSSRLQADIDRYVKVIETALQSGVRHPQLFKNKRGSHLYKPTQTNLQLLVMEWLDGSSFWDIGNKPTDKECLEIIEIAVSVNSIDYKPPFTYDGWAITSFENEFKHYSDTLNSDDRQKVSEVLSEFISLELDSLPKALVHGDLIATNVIKTSRGLFVVDFSVANYYPRIQELAVLFCNLFFDENDAKNSERMYNTYSQAYSKRLLLTEAENKALPIYTKAAHAMHVIGASKAIVKGEDDEENQYWLNLGRKGLSMGFY